jgi:GT2 family glycosyltransferase
MMAARGSIFLFTDDDVCVPEGWIDGMCRPLLDGRADAVAGGVRLAPDLQRKWMTAAHRAWLADTGHLDPVNPGEFVGANMAFHRRVLDRVPVFDPELGPGAVGFGDETTFSRLVIAEGFRLISAFDVCVEHRCGTDRLTRKSFLNMAEKHGRTAGYLTYHQLHRDAGPAKRYSIKTGVKLWLLRKLHRRPPAEGLDPWESTLVQSHYFYRQLAKENGRPRRYAFKGGLTPAAVDAAKVQRGGGV